MEFKLAFNILELENKPKDFEESLKTKGNVKNLMMFVLGAWELTYYLNTCILSRDWENFMVAGFNWSEKKHTAYYNRFRTLARYLEPALYNR